MEDNRPAVKLQVPPSNHFEKRAASAKKTWISYHHGGLGFWGFWGFGGLGFRGLGVRV